MMKCGFRKS